MNKKFFASEDRIDWMITLVPFLLIVSLCVLFFVFPDDSNVVLNSIRNFLGDSFGVYYLLIGLGTAIASIYISCSKYGSIVLGDQDEKPKYSFFAWGSMMFTCGLAADILFYSLCEWILYWEDPHTAEMGDLVRGALESVPKHQYESGRAIGLTERQIFFYIIIPQTLRPLLPLSMNLITRMIKTTSLVVFVGVIEVVKIGQQIIEANRLTIPTASIAVYGLIFFMYFIVCWPLSLAADKIEKKQKL